MHTQNKTPISSLPQKSMGGTITPQIETISSDLSRQISPLSAKNKILETSGDKKESTPFERKSNLLTWKALSFVSVPKSNIWYVIVFIVLVSLVAIGLFSDNFPLAILAILIGLILYLFEKKEAQSFNFGVTPKGVFAHDRLYKFSSLENFWIFYEPNGKKDLSLKSSKSFIPYITIPLGDVDPALLRKNLLQFLPEVEHEEVVLDSLERLF